jgi:uncharacterized protein (UPF0332 family)
MPNATRWDLALARLEKATRCLLSAENVIADGDLETAANRSYYCIFHSMKAVLALDEFDSKSHGAIIGKFREKYIKTGIFLTEYSKTIGSAFDIRNESDYEDFYVITQNDVSIQVEKAREFLEAVKEYTTHRIHQEQGG